MGFPRLAVFAFPVTLIANHGLERASVSLYFRECIGLLINPKLTHRSTYHCVFPAFLGSIMASWNNHPCIMALWWSRSVLDLTTIIIIFRWQYGHSYFNYVLPLGLRELYQNERTIWLMVAIGFLIMRFVYSTRSERLLYFFFNCYQIKM